MSPHDLAVAADVAHLAGAPDLLAWLGLPEQADAGEALTALRARRRALQAMQANPKHRELARAVIRGMASLEAALAHPKAYQAAVQRDQAEAHLPLLDMGVDGVLADGVVTPEELGFVERTARAFGLTPDVAHARLRHRAGLLGVDLDGVAVAEEALSGPAHPLLPPGFWTPAFSAWLASVVPADARAVVDLRCGEGWAAMALGRHRPALRYLGFDEPGTVALAEAALERASVDAATVLPGSPTALPLSAASADAALLLFTPTPPEVLREARRVVRPGGAVVVVDVGPPLVAVDGPRAALGAALWALCEAAGIGRAAGPDVSVTAVGVPLAGDPRPALRRWVGALERLARVGADEASVAIEALPADPAQAYALLPVTATRLWG